MALIYKFQKGSRFPKVEVSESTKPAYLPVRQDFDFAVVKKKKDAERKKVAEVIKKSPLISSTEKVKILMSNKKLDENKHLAHPTKPDTVKSYKPATTTEKVWTAVTNPVAAAEAAVAGETLARGYNAAKVAGVDLSPDQGRNIVGNALNANLNLLDAGDKVVRNVGAGNYATAGGEALRFLPILGTSSRIVSTTKSGLYPLNIGTKQSILGKISDKTKNYLENTIVPNTQHVLLPLTHKKEIANIKNIFAAEKNYLSRPEIIEDLKKLGVKDAENFHKDLKYKISGRDGSNYDTGNGLISINPRDLSRVKNKGITINQEGIVGHEIGHKIEHLTEGNLNPAYKNMSDVNHELLLLKPADKLHPHELNNFTYFNKDEVGYLPERYAHAREMKKGLVDRGLIADMNSKVSEKHLLDYISSYKRDRIASFIDPTKLNLKRLSSALTSTRVAVPTLGGLTLLNREK